jgi:hypothetical protein
LDTYDSLKSDDNKYTDLTVIRVPDRFIAGATPVGYKGLKTAKYCTFETVSVPEGDSFWALGPNDPAGSTEVGEFPYSTCGPVVNSYTENKLLVGHHCSTQKGWSGCGLFINHNTKYYLGAVHVGSRGSVNIGVLVDEIIEAINDIIDDAHDLSVKEGAHGSGVRKGRMGGMGSRGKARDEARRERDAFLHGTHDSLSYSDARYKAQYEYESSKEVLANKALERLNVSPSEVRSKGREAAACSTDARAIQEFQKGSLSEIQEESTTMSTLSVPVVPVFQPKEKAKPTPKSLSSSTGSSPISAESTTCPSSIKPVSSSHLTNITQKEDSKLTMSRLCEELRQLLKTTPSMELSLDSFTRQDLDRLILASRKRITALSPPSSGTVVQATPTSSSKPQTESSLTTVGKKSSKKSKKE